MKYTASERNGNARLLKFEAESVEDAKAYVDSENVFSGMNYTIYDESEDPVAHMESGEWVWWQD